MYTNVVSTHLGKNFAQLGGKIEKPSNSPFLAYGGVNVAMGKSSGIDSISFCYKVAHNFPHKMHSLIHIGWSKMTLKMAVTSDV